MPTHTAVPASTNPLDALNKAEAEARREFEAKLAEFNRRREMVQSALEGIDIATGGESSNGNGAKKSTPVDVLSISPERQRKVQQFLEKHPRARQATIVKRTKINSGAVSVALRKLEAEGFIERADEKEDGSYVWMLREAEQAAAA